MNEEIVPFPEVNAILRRDFGVELNQEQAEEVARAIAKSKIGNGSGVAFILVNALHLLSPEEMEDLARKIAVKCGGRFVRKGETDD